MFYLNHEVVGGGRPAPGPTRSTLDVLQDCVRAENRAAGCKLRAILGHVEAARRGAGPDEESQEEATESAEAEIGLALEVTPVSASRWVSLALDLSSRLPMVLAALEAGSMTLPKARVLLEETQELDAEVLARLAAELLAKAQGRTPSALRRVVRRAVLRADADAARKRRQQAVRERGVSLVPAPDGMAHIHAFLPAEDAVAVFGLIDSLAHCTVPGDDRGIDARRADALVDLIVRPNGQQRVQYVVHAEQSRTATAAAKPATPAGQSAQSGQSTEPGGSLVYLRGYGPVPAQVLRDLGIDDHPDRYVPGAKLAAAVRERDQHCRFPSCRRPADQCELDHTIRFRCGGRTIYLNLNTLCKHHHRVKHLPGWNLNLMPDGTTIWTTPSGRTYRTTPRWLADDEPPDFVEGR